MMARTLAAMLGGLSLGLIAMPSANAQTVEQFYSGKTITVLVGTSPGGINDITARFAAKHFGRFIPGNPLISRADIRRAAAASSLPTASTTRPSGTAPCSPSSSARRRSSPFRVIRRRSSIRPSSSGSAACRPMRTMPT